MGVRPPARILIEASTESEWVARCLEAQEHEVIVADPHYAPMYALGLEAELDRSFHISLLEDLLDGLIATGR